MSPLRALFSTEIFMPRGHDYFWTPKLLVLEGASNLVLAIAGLVLARRSCADAVGAAVLGGPANLDRAGVRPRRSRR